jgi:hypothetical protein
MKAPRGAGGEALRLPQGTLRGRWGVHCAGSCDWRIWPPSSSVVRDVSYEPLGGFTAGFRVQCRRGGHSEAPRVLRA